MNLRIYFTITALLCLTITIAQQGCSDFYPFEQGVTFQITSYGKNKKVAAITDFLVTEATDNFATFKSFLRDKDGEVLNEATFTMSCENDGIVVDMESLVNPNLLENYRDFETEISGTQIVIPNNLHIGQELPDATMNMRMDMSGINISMEVSMTDRTVLTRETITTRAGTFECFVIGYTNTVNMGINRTTTAKQWIARGVGMVKQEDYNRRGNITSSSVLTDFHR
ncbi:TapB family protein [Rasiella sp. SM2506]|uniref:TapB family protein n=1 Tax=Rasiella sp. SM2506 TaxID=3423914 RepID=UPI003D7AE560